MLYEELLEEAHREGLLVKERVLLSDSKGLCKNNKIALNQRLLSTTIDKRCTLSEELWHFRKTVGDITNQSDVENRKQERVARKSSFQDLVSITLLVQALGHPCQSLSELADYLTVTEPYLLEAIEYYKQKHGLYCIFNEYIVCFEPLRLIKKI